MNVAIYSREIWHSPIEVTMKRGLLLVILLAVNSVFVACVPSATPTPTLDTKVTATKIVATQTASVPTAPPTPTQTSTSRPMGTSTITPTPTLTSTPTKLPTQTATNTPKPTETPRPMKIIFQRDFNSGQLDIVKASPDHWNFLHEDGTKVEVIPDPTNSLDANGKPRGYVMKATIQGDPVQHPDWGSNLWWRNGDPDWTYGYPVKLVRAPSAIQVDVHKPSDLYGIALLGVHRQNKTNVDDRTSVAGIEIYRGDSLVQVVRDGQGKDTRTNLKPGLFKSNQWNTLRLDFLTDGSVIPYVNGENALMDPSHPLKVPVDDKYDAGFADGHAGLQSANQDKNDGFKDGQYLLNDNFMVFEYD